MTTIAEIESVLPGLTTGDLRKIEEAIHQQYGQRNAGIIYDDAYGVVTEADLIASADRIFLAYDAEERAEAERKKQESRGA